MDIRFHSFAVYSDFTFSFGSSLLVGGEVKARSATVVPVNMPGIITVRKRSEADCGDHGILILHTGTGGDWGGTAAIYTCLSIIRKPIKIRLHLREGCESKYYLRKAQC